MLRWVRAKLDGIITVGVSGLLLLALACTTKESVTSVNSSPGTPASIESVVVAPASAGLTVGGTLALAATVTADSALPRTMTWSSADSAVASVSSAGLVTAISVGTTVITAKSTYTPTVFGQASITVTGAAPVVPVPPSILIEAVLQGPCSIPTCPANLTQNVPIDLTNVQGQINVNVLYSPGSKTIARISVLLAPVGAATGATCGTASSGLQSATTITIPCNTAAYDTTQVNQASVTTWKNGQYLIGVTLTATDSTSASAASTSPATLANGDWVRATFGSPPTTPATGQVATATDTNGLVWHAGSVNTKVVPVLYTPGRSIAAATVNLVNGGSGGATNDAVKNGVSVGCGGILASEGGISSFPTPPAFSVSLSTILGVSGITADTLAISVGTIDNFGNAGPAVFGGGTNCNSPTFTPAPSVTGGGTLPTGNFIRLDNMGPTPGAYVVTPSQGGAPSTRNVIFPYAPIPGDTGFVTDNNTQNQTLSGTTVWFGAGYLFSAASGFGYVQSPISPPSNNASAPTPLVPLTVNGDSNGVGRVGVTFQYATASGGAPTASTAYTTVTAASQIPATSAATAYWLRMIEHDALGNTTTTNLTWGGGTNGTSTFGVDLTPPVMNLVSGPAFEEIDGFGTTISHSTVVVSASDPPNGNGTLGSGLSATPVAATISGISGTTGRSVCAVGIGGAVCSAPTFSATNLALGAATGDGDWLMTYSVLDQAGNATASSTLKWYIDTHPPTLASTDDIVLPATLDSTFTFATTAFDSLYLAGANLQVHYPGAGVRLYYPGTSSAVGVPFSLSPVKQATISANITQWYRTIYVINAGVIGGGGKPDSVGLRATDAANNLSAEDEAGIPAANVSGTGAVGGTTGFTTTGGTANLSDFNLTGAFSNPTVSLAGQTSGTPRFTTITASVPAPSTVTSSPFSTVCFYYQTNTGNIVAGQAAHSVHENGAGSIAGAGPNELVLIGCSSTPAVALNGSVRTFSYTSAAFTPDARFLATGASTVSIYAIGVNATHDALITPAAGLNIVP